MGFSTISRANYKPLGRQPFRPGQWQGYKGASNHTTYIQNNFFGSSYGSGFNYNYGYNYNYGTCCNHDDGGMSKGMKWLLGIGLGTTLLGGILKMFGVGGGAATVSTDTSRNTDGNNVDDKKNDAKVDDGKKTDTVNGSNSTDDSSKVDEGKNKTKVEKPENKPLAQDILKVEKQEIKETTSYTVQHGDTWANIIMAKYKDENGNPISFADAKELWTQLKQECGVSKDADGMPSNIELPNEFKNYKLDINGKVTPNTNFDNPNYKEYNGNEFKPKTSTNYTATGTINGKSIGKIQGSGAEVTEQLRKQGFSDKDIKTAMENGEVKITKDKTEE